MQHVYFDTKGNLLLRFVSMQRLLVLMTNIALKSVNQTVQLLLLLNVEDRLLSAVILRLRRQITTSQSSVLFRQWCSLLTFLKKLVVLGILDKS